MLMYLPFPSLVDVSINQSSHQPRIASFDPSRYLMAQGMDFMQNLSEYQSHVLMERGESSRLRQFFQEVWQSSSH